MNIEDQVCSLELAKRLKELGVKQDSLFDWVVNNHEPEYYLWLMSPYNRENLKFKDQYSAFTVAELGEMLPSSINSWGLCFDATSCVVKDIIKNLWHVTYSDYDKKLMEEISDLNLINVMAKMLIHLIENKLL